MSERNEWKPTPKQAEFLSIPFSIKEALFGGGAGSGKSDLLLLYGIVHRLHENPEFKQVFQRRTFPELRNEIVPRSRELYRRFGATFNKTDMCWTFPRPDQHGAAGFTKGNEGALIFLGHCENEDDVHQYDSMQINLYTPDELTSFTEWIYLYIGFERTRARKGSGLPAIIRGAGMPGGIGHTWTYKRLIKPCPEGGKVLIGKGGNKRFYIHATEADNPHVDPNYKQSLEALPEAEKKAKKYGDWNAYQGQVFDEFRDRKYPDEPDNALHICDVFDIPDWWPRIVIGDWGFRAMTWIGHAAISPMKRVYIYREQHWVKTKIAEWAPYLKLYVDREQPKLIRFCKSAGQDRGQEHTIQQQIEQELGQSIELSVNSPGSRIAGKLLIHEYLRWKHRFVPESELPKYDEEYAMWILRNKGLEQYKSYMNSLNPPEIETNIPKLQIFKDCAPVLVEAIKAASYDKPKKNKPAEDIAEFEGDDPIDGLRYLVDAAESYFDEANQEFKRVQKQEILLNQLQHTQDYTAFYRQSEKMESEDIIKPISRYRH